MELSEAGFFELIDNLTAIIIIGTLAITVYKIVKAILGRKK